MTGFAYFMRWYLTNLPDLVARYHLDFITNSQTPDSSKNLEHATVFGASVTDGIVANSFDFDGVDNRCVRAYDTLLDLTDALTIEVFVNPAVLAGIPKGIVCRAYAADILPYGLVAWTDRIRFFSYDGGLLFTVGYTPPALDVWYHVVATFDESLPSDNAKLFVDGILRDAANYTSPLPTNTSVLYLGTYDIQYYTGLIDEARLYNRAMAQAQITRHAARRYPL